MLKRIFALFLITALFVPQSYAKVADGSVGAKSCNTQNDRQNSNGNSKKRGNNSEHTVICTS